MNVFEAVKDSITTRQAAAAYGIQVKSNGMACCPFHNDRNPSMKLDKRFHCFGCQADGDVIDFTAQLFGIGTMDAAKKLADDFGIIYDRKPSYGKRQKSVVKKIQPDPVKELEQWRNHAMDVLVSYKWKLRDFQERYAPKSMDEEWHPLFVEALQNKDKIEYWMDELTECSTDQLPEMKKCCGKEVDAIGKKLERYAERDASEDRER